MLRPWLAGDRRLDVDVAREMALQVQSEVQQHGPEPAMSESLENEVLRVIQQARKALVH